MKIPNQKLTDNGYTLKQALKNIKKAIDTVEKYGGVRHAKDECQKQEKSFADFEELMYFSETMGELDTIIDSIEG
jgi:predicted RNase H-like HicB family nuclease